jgi:hypothetical protein
VGLLCAFAIGGLDVACGGGGRSATAPTPIPASGSARVVAGLLTLQRTGSAGTRANYDLRGDIRFRNEGRMPLHLTSLLVDFIDADGQSEQQLVPIDVTVDPGETAVDPFPIAVSLAIDRHPVRVRLRARGMNTDGVAAATDSAESVVSLTDPPAPAGGGDATILAAGDIADCSTTGAAQTARLLDTLPGDVLTLGDHGYPAATRQVFSSCYEPTWGRHKSRTWANPGNHDWGEEYGSPYFEYFGAGAGPRTGYYSFDLGAWHILSHNSNIAAGVNSPQFQWVVADLMAHPSKCTMAVWHHARFSSGPNGDSAQMQQMWWLLDGNGVDVVLNAHEHMYERFAPQDHEGVPSPNGIRLFVVGTGGGALAGPQSIKRNSEVRGSSFGVLRMTLRADSYAWQFVSVPGAPLRDAGTDTCR